MKKFFGVLVAISLLAGCAGTLELGGHPIIGFTGERDKDGKPIPHPPAVVVQQFGGIYQQAPAPSGTSPQLAQAGDTMTRPTTAALKPSHTKGYQSKWDNPTLVVL